MLLTFSQQSTLQEAFETVEQMDEELKRTEFDGEFWRKIQTFNRWIFFIFAAKRRKSVCVRSNN